MIITLACFYNLRVTPKQSIATPNSIFEDLLSSDRKDSVLSRAAKQPYDSAARADPQPTAEDSMK